MAIQDKSSCCVTLLVLQICCTGAASPSSAFLGKWIVKEVVCTDCGQRTPSEKGAVIELTDKQIRNPLAENCPDSPGYGLLTQMPGAEVIAQHGAQWPQSVRRAVLKEARVKYGFITCDGINLMRMLFLSEKHAYYFGEGAIIFDLQRE